MWKAIKAIAIFYIAQFGFSRLLSIFELNRESADLFSLILADLAVILYFLFVEKVRISLGMLKVRPLPTLGLCACIPPFLIVFIAFAAFSLDLPNTLDLSLKDVSVPLVFASIGIIGPIAEEVVFRGAVLGSLFKWKKLEGEPWIAIFLSAILFSLCHLNPAQAPVTLILGLFAGWLYFRTDSLLPGMVFHIMNNSLVCVIIAVLRDSKAMAFLEKWEPSTAFLVVSFVVALALTAFLLICLVKVVKRDLPVKTLSCGTEKISVGKIGLCASILAVFVAALAVLGAGKRDNSGLVETFGDFHEGLAEVEMNGKSGFIDRNGDVVIPCEYDRVSAGGFNEGLCGVEKDGLWGYIDRKGEIVIPMEFSNAGRFSDGYAQACKNDKYGFIDKEGNAVVPFEYDGASAFQNGKMTVAVNDKYGVIDLTGVEVVPFEYDYIYSFHDDLAMVSKDRKYGFIDSDGRVVISVEYDSASLFRDGLSVVSKDREFGSIDTTGAVVIPLKYDNLQRLDEGLFFAKSGERSEMINIKENTVVPFEYRSVIWYADGLAMVELNDKQSALVHLDGEIQERFDYSVLSYSEAGLAHAVKGKKEGVVDFHGRVIVPFKFDDVREFSEGLGRACKGRYRHYIDTEGKIVIKVD